MAFPTSPTIGQIYNNYQWNGEAWDLYITNPSALGSTPSTIKDYYDGINKGNNNGVVFTGDGLDFNGSSYINFTEYSNTFISNPSISGQLTIEMWLFIRGGNYIFSSGSQTSSIGLHINNAQGIGLKDGNYGWNISSSFIQNSWFHLALAWDGSNLHFYENSTLKNSDTSPATNSESNSHTNVSLGAPNNSLDSYHFNGMMSDIRIWNVARTQTEIQDNMNRLLRGNEPGLMVYYPIMGVTPKI